VLATFTLAAGAPALADEYAPKLTHCELQYNTKGWSFLIKRMKGAGRIECEDGQSAEIDIQFTAVGLTGGKSEITEGKGIFSSIVNIHETFGTYLSGEAHAGASKSVSGSAMTKNGVSLALSGRGHGFDIGVNIGGFTINPKNRSLP
jgi:hypothetical protein